MTLDKEIDGNKVIGYKTIENIMKRKFEIDYDEEVNEHELNIDILDNIRKYMIINRLSWMKFIS